MNLSGQEWIRTTEVERQRIYSPPHLAALEPARTVLSRKWDSNPRPADYKSAALPTELFRLKKNSLKNNPYFGMAKVMEIFIYQNFMQ